MAAGGTPEGDPPTLLDFCFWADVDEKPRPPEQAGAAMLALLQRDLLPALVMDGPWFAELEAQGRDVPPPKHLCWAAEDAILLAPYRADAEHWGGFLVARASAAGQVRVFASEEGEEVSLLVPADAVPPQAFAGCRANALAPIWIRES